MESLNLLHYPSVPGLIKMGVFFFYTLVIIFIIAVVTQQSFVFTLLYLLVIVYFINIILSNLVNQKLGCKRDFTMRAFPDEIVKVNLRLTNHSRLPLVYARIHEAMPAGVSLRLFQRVVSLGPKQSIDLQYELTALKRGYFQLGPLQVTSGDLMGFIKERSLYIKRDPLIVYPRIYNLVELGLPSHAPLGTKKFHQPIFEDTSRPTGKRDYQSGDSLKRIDWKSSASTGKLQVKLFDAAIALETIIILDLDTNNYDAKRKFDATELAISTAASVANWVINQRQSIGLFTNGYDSSDPELPFPTVHPGKGKGQLMHILELLARIKTSKDESIASLINRQRVELSWGSTIVFVSGDINDETFTALLNSRRAGLDIVLVICGMCSNLKEIKTKAKITGFGFHHLRHVEELKEWGVRQ
jgi:uncharacterized protein (DUF58 family)